MKLRSKTVSRFIDFKKQELSSVKRKNLKTNWVIKASSTPSKIKLKKLLIKSKTTTKSVKTSRIIKKSSSPSKLMKMNNVDGEKVYVKLWTWSLNNLKNAGFETLCLKDSPNFLNLFQNLKVGPKFLKRNTR